MDITEVEIVKKYPTIFREVGMPETQSCMAFGLAVGKGWLPLIDRLCAAIMEQDGHEDVYAVQVKEKFGGLRFYVNSAPSAVHDLINAAEDESFQTCEGCGTMEGVETGGKYWIKTYCSACRAPAAKEDEKDEAEDAK